MFTYSDHSDHPDLRVEINIKNAVTNIRLVRSYLPILPETYCKPTQTDKSSKTYLKTIIIQSYIYQQLCKSTKSDSA